MKIPENPSPHVPKQETRLPKSSVARQEPSSGPLLDAAIKSYSHFRFPIVAEWEEAHFIRRDNK